MKWLVLIIFISTNMLAISPKLSIKELQKCEGVSIQTDNPGVYLNFYWYDTIDTSVIYKHCKNAIPKADVCKTCGISIKLNKGHDIRIGQDTAYPTFSNTYFSKDGNTDYSLNILFLKLSKYYTEISESYETITPLKEYKFKFTCENQVLYISLKIDKEYTMVTERYSIIKFDESQKPKKIKKK